jgi:7-carboxy-7-deazaguanine synthase
MLKVNEFFESISGEGVSAGIPCFFLRLSGCNLNCTYCDTMYHTEGVEFWEPDLASTVARDLVFGWEKKGIKTLIITGGEPLLRKKELIKFLKELDMKLDNTEVLFQTRIETNGAFSISELDCENFGNLSLSYSMDFKLPSAFEDYLDWLSYSHDAYQNIEGLRISFIESNEVKLVIDPNSSDDITAVSNFFEESSWTYRVIAQPVWGCNLNDLIQRFKNTSFYGKLVFREQMHKVYQWR